MYARVTGTGSCLPGKPVSNDDLAASGIDTNDEWIVSRTGIRSRFLAAPGTTSSDLGLVAAQQALEMAGVAAGEIDLIIVATSTPDFIFPSTACLIQGRLGSSKGAAAFDVQAVCSGFVYALGIAEKFIRSGSHRKALVIGAEVFSRILDWNDRGTCVLFATGRARWSSKLPKSRGYWRRRCMPTAARNTRNSSSGSTGSTGRNSSRRSCTLPRLIGT